MDIKSSKYRNTVKHMSILGIAVKSPKDEKVDGILHKVTRKRQADVRRCK